jgi:hypothetical protein
VSCSCHLPLPNLCVCVCVCVCVCGVKARAARKSPSPEPNRQSLGRNPTRVQPTSLPHHGLVQGSGFRVWVQATNDFPLLPDTMEPPLFPDMTSDALH